MLQQKSRIKTALWALFLLSLTLHLSLAFGGAPPAADSAVDVVLLHTNDLHSQFKEKKYPFRIGGVARLKTAVDAIRRAHPLSTLVDGGDWSEGSIYYTLGTGLESIRMLDHLGYNFAVIGNHDWLNGPDQLLDSLKLAQPKTQFLSHNLSIPDSYPRKREFQETILPYKIENYNGRKIAWIGLSTYEFIYDQYLKPIKITNPFTATASLARKLKKEDHVDGVVVLSHNNIKINERILKTANEFAGQNLIDLVIGAHDHIKLTRPVEVKRLARGPAAWIVETGSGGEYLGQINVKLSPGKMELLDYRLIQLDSQIPEDPETLERIKQLDEQVESKYGPIFEEEIGTSQVDFSGVGVENLMGDWVTDCYRRETGAQISIESNRFIYHPIQPGLIHTADLFNSLPPVYNPKTELTWTLKTFPMRGKTLKWLLYLLFGTKKLSSYGLINVSGLKLKYDPLFAAQTEYDPGEPADLAADLQGPDRTRFMGIESIPVVKDILVLESNSDFQPLKDSFYYSVATGGGLIEGIRWLNSKLWSVIPLDELKDTGKENWRVLVDQIKAHSPLTPSNVTVGDRIQTAQSNLGVYPTDVTWTALPSSISELAGITETAGKSVEIRAKIRNYGGTPSKKGPQVRLLLNKNGTNLSIDPDYEENPLIYPLDAIAPGEYQELTWKIILPSAEAVPVTIRITGAEGEVNTTNHETTLWVHE